MCFCFCLFFAEEQVVREQEEDILSMKCMMEKLNQELEACGGLSSQPSSQRVRMQIQVFSLTTMNE